MTDTAEWTRVPTAALKWLNGEGPDHDGLWFRDHLGKRKYWWRKRFDEICASSPAPPATDTAALLEEARKVLDSFLSDETGPHDDCDCACCERYRCTQDLLSRLSSLPSPVEGDERLLKRAALLKEPGNRQMWSEEARKAVDEIEDRFDIVLCSGEHLEQFAHQVDVLSASGPTEAEVVERCARIVEDFGTTAARVHAAAIRASLPSPPKQENADG